MANYKILSFDKYTGCLLIKFAENISPLSIDVPLTNEGLFIVGEELEQHIQNFIPTWHIERLEKLKSGIANASEIESLVSPVEETVLPPTPQVSPEELANLEMWENFKFEQKVAKALVKFKILETDPTEITNTTL